MTSGWQLGSRDSYRYWGPYLAARGHALFAVGYRLSKPNEKSYPGAVHDIRAGHSGESQNCRRRRYPLEDEARRGPRRFARS